MEEEVLKVNIYISDEGVVYIESLTADMEAFLGSVLRVIESASRILGVSMKETYQKIVERLNYLEQDKG